VDILGNLDPCKSQRKEEMETTVLEHFERTVRKDPEGRYDVIVPWLCNREEVPDNRKATEERLRSTPSSLKAATDFEENSEVIWNWLCEEKS
jgi:hypothetical protein